MELSGGTVASRQFADLCDAMAVRHRHGFFWILFKQGRAGVGVLTDVFFPLSAHGRPENWKILSGWCRKAPFSFQKNSHTSNLQARA